MRRQSGFTLIELMIVVAIIAILSAIAIPAYSDYIMRSRITEATSNLGGMRVKMEQFFQDNRSWASYPTGGANTVAPCPATSANFTYVCASANAGAGYSVTATGAGAMAGFSFTVDQANNRTSTGPTGWTSSSSCWILKRDGSC